MIPLYTENEFLEAKGIDLLPCECVNCSNTFYKEKKYIKSALKLKKDPCRFCSYNCHKLFKIKSNRILFNCKNCNKEIYKQPSKIKNYNNVFCSSSCSGTYNNLFIVKRNKGYSRSKLEKYLENKLTSILPNTEILYNNNTVINSELDIYIPSLKLAFELNGIFHYEPIYGSDKLNQIQNNDNRKFQACLENNIELCIIDTSHQNYVTDNTSKPFLDIILKIINQRTTVLTS